MSCRCNRDNCVCDAIRGIIKAQNEVADRFCTVSCHRSRRQLLSPHSDQVNTTIPIILYGKDNKPFIGSGIIQGINEEKKKILECVETPIFRAIKFVDRRDCCVKLELLLPVTQGGSTPGPSEDGVSDVCKFFPGRSIRNLQATGICLTIDLHCFCGLTCLDPITPLPASQFPKEDKD